MVLGRLRTQRYRFGTMSSRDNMLCSEVPSTTQSSRVLRGALPTVAIGVANRQSDKTIGIYDCQGRKEVLFSMQKAQACQFLLGRQHSRRSKISLLSIMSVCHADQTKDARTDASHLATPEVRPDLERISSDAQGTEASLLHLQEERDATRTNGCCSPVICRSLSSHRASSETPVRRLQHGSWISR